jgi:serine/threonine-protein kinase
MPTEVYSPRSQVREARDFNTATMPAIGHDPDDEPRKKRGVAYTAIFVIGLAAIIGLVWLGMNLLNGGTPPATKVQVPQVVGLQEPAATALLDSRKLVPQVNRVASDKPIGEVVSQSHPANTYVPEGTRINLEVSSGPDTVTIPDLKGYSVAEARSALTDLNVVVAAQTEPVDDSQQDKGKVDSTDPAAGQQVPTGTTVKLRVSSGKVTVPNVVGKTADEARTLLADAGLRSKSELVPSTSPEGTVIEQTPKDGLADRDSTVVIKVATKLPPTVTQTQTVTETPTTTATPTTGTTRTTGTSPPPTTP